MLRSDCEPVRQNDLVLVRSTDEGFRTTMFRIRCRYMESNRKPTSLTWHCDLDRQMRLVYLGTDETEARRLAVEGGVMRSARTMGDAMLTAALAFGAERHDR